jgi:hypothetical protein
MGPLCSQLHGGSFRAKKRDGEGPPAIKTIHRLPFNVVFRRQDFRLRCCCCFAIFHQGFSLKCMPHAADIFVSAWSAFSRAPNTLVDMGLLGSSAKTGKQRSSSEAGVIEPRRKAWILSGSKTQSIRLIWLVFLMNHSPNLENQIWLGVWQSLFLSKTNWNCTVRSRQKPSNLNIETMIEIIYICAIRIYKFCLRVSSSTFLWDDVPPVTRRHGCQLSMMMIPRSINTSHNNHQPRKNWWWICSLEK